MGTVVAVLFAGRSSSRRVPRRVFFVTLSVLAERSLPRRGRFAISFAQTSIVALSIHVEDVGKTVSTFISHYDVGNSVAVSTSAPKG
jgi:hypothetical protein